MLRDDEAVWEDKKAIWEGDSLLRIEDLEWASASDFNSNKVIILIHGFTAHGKYLITLGKYFQRNGFQVLLYNYNSYKGIEKIAETLQGLLNNFESSSGLVTRNRFFVVAHSLGGLVARRLVLYPWLAPTVRGIVMLGTPNNGCFRDERILEYILAYGQYIGDALMVTNVACKTARELIKNDAPRTVLSLTQGIIDRLNRDWKRNHHVPPSLTISGGMPSLPFSKNPRLNWAANHTIQKAMRREANDGLVQEKSVDLTALVYPKGSANYSHNNSYPEYPNINHSNLKENQSIALKVVSWLNSLP